MTLSLIVAMTQDHVIGKNNQLPWPKIKEDMQHFKQITAGHAVIMGRKTYDSIGKPLPNRTNIVVTQQLNLTIDGCQVCNNTNDAINFAYTLDTNPFIIGGASLYAETLPLVDQIYLTVVKDSYDGDTYFPVLNETQWNKEILKETEKVTFYLLKKKEN